MYLRYLRDEQRGKIVTSVSNKDIFTQNPKSTSTIKKSFNQGLEFLSARSNELDSFKQNPLSSVTREAKENIESNTSTIKESCKAIQHLLLTHSMGSSIDFSTITAEISGIEKCNDDIETHLNTLYSFLSECHC